MKNILIKTTIDAFTDLFFPRLCLGCGQKPIPETTDLCVSCSFYIPKTEHHLYKVNEATAKFEHKMPVHSAASYLKFTKGGHTQNLIHQIKYHGKKETAIKIGEIFGKLLAESPYFRGIDGIVPVPMSPIKIRMRGYNQAQMFAEGLSSKMELPIFENALHKVKHTISQTKKNKLSRLTNVEEIFVLGNDNLENKHILLVDDVLTTGATLLACGDELRKVSNLKISIATIAIANY